MEQIDVFLQELNIGRTSTILLNLIVACRSRSNELHVSLTWLNPETNCHSNPSHNKHITTRFSLPNADLHLPQQLGTKHAALHPPKVASHGFPKISSNICSEDHPLSSRPARFRVGWAPPIDELHRCGNQSIDMKIAKFLPTLLMILWNFVIPRSGVAVWLPRSDGKVSRCGGQVDARKPLNEISFLLVSWSIELLLVDFFSAGGSFTSTCLHDVSTSVNPLVFENPKKKENIYYPRNAL